MLTDGALIDTLQGMALGSMLPSPLAWSPDSSALATCFTATGHPHPNRDSNLGVWRLGKGCTTHTPLGDLVTSDINVIITGVYLVLGSAHHLHGQVFGKCCRLQIMKLQ